MHHDFTYINKEGKKKFSDKYFVHIKLKAGTPFVIFPFNKEQYEVLLSSNSIDIELVDEEKKIMVIIVLLQENVFVL